MIAVRAYFDGVNGPADRADLHFSSAAFPGYAWVFPTGEDSANVGVGIVLRTLPKHSEHLPKLLANLINDDAAIRHRVGGARVQSKRSL